MRISSSRTCCATAPTAQSARAREPEVRLQATTVVVRPQMSELIIKTAIVRMENFVVVQGGIREQGSGI